MSAVVLHGIRHHLVVENKPIADQDRRPADVECTQTSSAITSYFREENKKMHQRTGPNKYSARHLYAHSQHTEHRSRHLPLATAKASRTLPSPQLRTRPVSSGTTTRMPRCGHSCYHLYPHLSLLMLLTVPSTSAMRMVAFIASICSPRKSLNSRAYRPAQML